MEPASLHGTHEHLVDERYQTIRAAVRRLDHLQRDAGRRAGWVILVDSLLLAGITLLLVQNPTPDPRFTAFELAGMGLAAGISTLILVLSIGFALFGLSGEGLLSGIIASPVPGPGEVDFDAAQASGIQTGADFIARFQSAPRENLIGESMRTLVHQRGSLSRQVLAIQRGRFFLLLALVPWLIALFFRLSGLFL